MPANRSRLHLDADTSIRTLYQTLLERGHDVTRTPNDWMPRDATDEDQVLGATAQRRVLFTFNVRDFVPLARRHTHHAGILLAHQRQFTLSDLIGSLDRCLTETQAEYWTGLVRWLSDWRA